MGKAWPRLKVGCKTTPIALSIKKIQFIFKNILKIQLPEIPTVKYPNPC
jgi:hypothetical protein